MHRHETAKGAAGGAAAASVIPGVGTVVGGAIGAAVGHHKKKEHETEGTHQVNPFNEVYLYPPNPPS